MQSTVDGWVRAERLRALKDIAGVNQQDLGDLLGVSQPFISKVLRKEKPLSEEIAVRAAQSFHVPLSFFAVDDLKFVNATATFRKSSTATVTAERKVNQLAREVNRAWDVVSRESGYLDFPSTDLLAAGLGVENSAEQTRKVLGLSATEPIQNVTHILGLLGVAVVYPLLEDVEDAGHLAISLPSRENTRPAISIVHRTEGARQRLTLAHELGHLLFDQGLTQPIPSIRAPQERRAYDFAGALLLPESVARARINETTPLRSLLDIRREYGISVAATAVRAHRLGIITQHRFRSLQIQLANAGWRKREPVIVPPEKPSLFRQAAERVFGKKALAFKMSEALGLKPEWINSWLHLDSAADSAADIATADNFGDGGESQVIQLRLR
ncbi:XRE family transcriptional regulator [Actinotignum sp. GS-2025a]|uniref:XRE family transcriptional regulator n=1 Tax=Actinotignum sp. GS-2025a TaxID=3427274 RepID=UPI003F46B084